MGYQFQEPPQRNFLDDGIYYCNTWSYNTLSENEVREQWLSNEPRCIDMYSATIPYQFRTVNALDGMQRYVPGAQDGSIPFNDFLLPQGPDLNQQHRDQTQWLDMLDPYPHSPTKDRLPSPTISDKESFTGQSPSPRKSPWNGPQYPTYHMGEWSQPMADLSQQTLECYPSPHSVLGPIEYSDTNAAEIKPSSISPQEVQMYPDTDHLSCPREVTPIDMKLEMFDIPAAPLVSEKVPVDQIVVKRVVNSAELDSHIQARSPTISTRPESDTEEDNMDDGDDEDASSDYDPSASVRTRTRRRQNGPVTIANITKASRRRPSNGTQRRDQVTGSKVTKRPSRGSTIVCTERKHAANKPSRPFPCDLHFAGCAGVFGSKNEWKRHLHTQHLRLGYWRCDIGLCSEASYCSDHKNSPVATWKPNDFNRKDLFTQHLRRMHLPKGPSSADAPESAELIANAQIRCFHQVRKPPQDSKCLFCERVFTGAGSWEERMEHVGRHFEKDTNLRHPPALDEGFVKWLVAEGLVERKGRDGWRLVKDVAPPAAASITIRLGDRAGTLVDDSDEDDIDTDAEHEME